MHPWYKIYSYCGATISITNFLILYQMQNVKNRRINWSMNLAE